LTKIDVHPVLLSRKESKIKTMADGSALPMGCLMSYVKVHDNGTLNKYFNFPPYLIEYQEADWPCYIETARESAPSIWLFSCYMWNCDDNLEIARQIKEVSPGSLLIFGGPHVPNYVQDNEDFFLSHPFVDVTARGEGEITLAEIFEVVADAGSIASADLSDVDGISFRCSDGSIQRNDDRQRTRDLSIFPSPFLSGEFQHDCFYDCYGFVLETNRGCPYGCTFCDWGAATLQKVSLFDLDRVLAEIDYIGRRKGRNVYIADANFGAFLRDVEIAEALAASKQNYGFPTTFACSYAKHPSDKLAKIIKALNDGGLLNSGIISMQTTDPGTLEAIRRSNVKNSKYETLIDMFRDQGLKLSSELLIGLPGQTYESHKNDLQFFIDRKVLTSLFNVQVMPNAPMNEPSYREQYNIQTDEKGYVIASSTFTNNDYQEMQTLFLCFQVFYVLGVLKYYGYFLQAEHNILFMEFIDEFLKASQSDESRYPLMYKIKNSLVTKLDEECVGMPKLHWKTQDSEFLFSNLDSFYDEVNDFLQERYNVELLKTVRSTLTDAQKAVMPALGKKVPFTTGLDHDLVSYFKQLAGLTNVRHLPDSFRRLETYAPGELTARAIKSKTIDNLNLYWPNIHNNAGWELRSPLRFY